MIKRTVGFITLLSLIMQSPYVYAKEDAIDCVKKDILRLEPNIDIKKLDKQTKSETLLNYVNYRKALLYKKVKENNETSKRLLAEKLAKNITLSDTKKEVSETEMPKQEEIDVVEEKPAVEQPKEPQVQVDNALVDNSPLAFDSNGLLVETASGNAQQVINLLLGIPGHANGGQYHIDTGLDNLIDQLSTSEAVYVIHRCEGAGFGQTGAGYAGYDTPETHRAFVEQQVNNRFGGDIKALLKAWGTFSYGGY